MLSAEVLLFAPLLIFFSVIATYTDTKYKKIPNALILRIFASSFLLNLIYFFSGNGQLLTYLAFILVSATVSIVLWLLEFWSPGDVKFYTALSTMVHPISASSFFLPLLVFLVLSIIVTVLEAIITRKFSFQINFSFGMLLPMALTPFLSFLGLSFIPLVFILFFFGSKFEKFKNTIIVLSILSFIAFPLSALKILAFTLMFFLANSLKFKGRMISAPFISVSFIYLLVFATI